MEVLYAPAMKKSSKKSSPDRGRPKSDPLEAFTRRHVVNISPKMEQAVLKFAAANGVARLTDAMRQIMTKALKSEGYLQ